MTARPSTTSPAPFRLLLLLAFLLGWLGPGPGPVGAAGGELGRRSEAIAARFDTGPIEAGDRGWTSAELDLLEATLGRLSDEERWVLRGVRFVRKRRGFRPGHAGLYRTDRRGTRIEIFDLAFRGSSARGGRPNATIGHEIGHAVCFWDLRIANNEARMAVVRYNRGVEDYNALVRRHNRSGRSEQEQLRARIGRQGEDLKSLKGKVRKTRRTQRRVGRSLRDLRPREGVLRDYQRLLKGRRGPTAYGRRNLRESFAESFDLFHRDPARLKRVLPEVHAWFKEGGHVRHLR